MRLLLGFMSRMSLFNPEVGDFVCVEVLRPSQPNGEPTCFLCENWELLPTLLANSSTLSIG